jgi:hydroxyacylglutathione hydrolase
MEQVNRLLFKQYYLDCLSQASYLIGDRGTGRAVVVDPRRDVGEYLADAEAAGLVLERVLETHVHADFLSGHLELAKRTGARIGYASSAQVEFDVDLLDDGQRISLGEVELEILHTPGHTPESMCVVIRASATDAVPFGVLTGDTLFIGDVGRPDLLAANGWSAEELAAALFRSTREKLLNLPDQTRVFPAHGAGSACGKNLSSETSSTIGEQRRTNYALAPMSESEFVAVVREGQPSVPRYFAHASDLNRRQRAVLDEDAPVEALDFGQVTAAGPDVVVLDVRDPAEFADGHVRGAINVGLDGRFAERAGEVIDAATPIVLVVPPGREVEARNRLARIGFDGVLGYLAGGIDAVGDTGLDRARRLTATEFAGEASASQVVDLRGPGETAVTGMVAGAILIPLPELAARIGELSATRPVRLYCAGGYRSSIAASTLRAHGFPDVADLDGGFSAWLEARLPVAG